MILVPTCLRRFLPGAAFAVTCAVMSGAGQAYGQDGDSDVEVRELRAALKSAHDQLNLEKVRRIEVEGQRKALGESLAEAVRVSEEQMIASRETQLKLQALGVDLFTRDENSLEQRLLKAVRDLDIAQQEIEQRSAAIRQLSEAFLKVLKSTPEIAEGAKKEAEKVIAAAASAISTEGDENNGAAGDLSGTRIVSMDGGVGLIVFDAGIRSGLRVGTPVAVLRDDRPIYSAIIVDVRESISGAVLQDKMAGEGEVAIGDGIRLLPDQRTL